MQPRLPREDSAAAEPPTPGGGPLPPLPAEGWEIDQSKAHLRSRLRRSRRERAASVPAASFVPGLTELLSWIEADPVMAGGALVATSYLPAPGEPDPTALHPMLADRGWTVLLPRARPPGRMSWVVWGPGQPVVRGPLGVDEPADGTVIGGADELAGLGPSLLVLPALAVDLGGRRLGQGGGFYDRLLARLAAAPGAGPVVAAVVHDDELLPAGTIPIAPHDMRAHAAVTPTGVFWLPTAAPVADEVEVAAGGRARVALPGQGDGGYRWVLVEPPGRHGRPRVARAEVVPAAQAPQRSEQVQPGMAYLEISGVRPGRAVVRLRLSRPWASAPLLQHALRVVVTGPAPR